MITDLQKASMWKRISAWLLDIILLATLVVGVNWGLSALFGYDAYYNTYNDALNGYQEQYGITFEIAQTDYMALTEEDRANWDAAYEALIADESAMYAYNMVVNLSMLNITLSVLIAFLLLEFILPLLLGNGMTLGKKVFAIAVVRTDCVKLTPVQLLIRTLLGKYTIETMVPVLIVMMIWFGILGLTGTLVLLGIVLVQFLMVACTRRRTAIHDALACTVAVDIASQLIFPDHQAMIAYKEKIHAEKAANAAY